MLRPANIALFTLIISSAACGRRTPHDSSYSQKAAIFPPRISDAELDANLSKILSTLSNDGQNSERLVEASASFVGAMAPYDNDSPLGEGPGGDGFDNDPRIRLDAFDCVTIVETSLALSLGQTPSEVRAFLDMIRYRNGDVKFVTRNHFSDADWIPNNIAAGFVRDVTAEVATTSQFALESGEALINRRGWYEKKHREALQAFLASGLPEIQETFVPYISLDAIFGISAETRAVYLAERRTIEERLAAAPEQEKPVIAKELSDHWNDFKDRFKYSYPKLLTIIKDGSIVNTVRPNWDQRAAIGTAMNISHQGMAVWKDGILYYRNASSTEGKVIDIPFISHLIEQLPSPTIKGMNILVISEQSPSGK